MLRPCDCWERCGDDAAVRGGDAQPCATRRAFQIADQAMYERLVCECMPLDGDQDGLCVGLTLGLVDERANEVPALSKAAEAIREAFEWLQPRGYVQLSTDQDGKYIDVLKRPGEE